MFHIFTDFYKLFTEDIMTREERLSLGLHILTMLEAYISNALWNMFYLEFKKSYEEYLKMYNGRLSSELARKTAVENLKVTVKSLDETLSKVARLLKNEVGEKEIKYREFFSSGKLSDVIKGNVTDQIVAIDYLLKALEKNNTLMVYNMFYQTIKDLKTALEKDYKDESDSQKAEGNAIVLLKLEESRFDFALRQIKHFVQDHVDAKEAERILKTDVYKY